VWPVMGRDGELMVVVEGKNGYTYLGVANEMKNDPWLGFLDYWHRRGDIQSQFAEQF
jgi:hypothetical protein